MILNKICAPALLYVAFSMAQIIIDIFKRMYNTAFFKFIVMIIFTFALNFLCNKGLGIVSWFIVFVPFIMMTVITTILLYVFGMDPQSGKLKIMKKGKPQESHRSKPPQCRNMKCREQNPRCSNSNCSKCHKQQY